MDDNILNVSELYFSYSNSKHTLFDVSFNIVEEDIFFLIGANGSGKSTLLKNILGLLTPDTGEVIIDSVLMSYANRLPLMSKIGVLIENAAFYGHLSVQQNAHIIAQYYKVPKANADEALKVVGLASEKDKKAALLSTGFKQRLGLALAILHQPKLVILDEPTNGLDPQGIIDFRDLVWELNKSRGITFFMTTHILNEVERLATRVAIIRDGHILDTFSIQELHQNYQTVKITEWDEATLLTLASDKNLLYYKSGNTIQVVLPKTTDVNTIGLLNNDLQSLTSPVDLETYYLARCYHYDASHKN